MVTTVLADTNTGTVKMISPAGIETIQYGMADAVLREVNKLQNLGFKLQSSSGGIFVLVKDTTGVKKEGLA